MLEEDHDTAILKQQLSILKRHYHSRCIFSRASPFDGLEFEFQQDGMLYGTIVFKNIHQGYDNMVHGGLVSSIVDASMTQCLFGHDIVAYTADLSIRYKKPVYLNTLTVFKTKIVSIKREAIYTLQCLVEQNRDIIACATGKFIRTMSG